MEDPGSLVESCQRALEWILRTHRGRPIRRTWIDATYTEEEPSWQPPEMELVMSHHFHRRTAHVFRAELSVLLEQPKLLQGQDMGLVSPEELLAGAIWSTKLGTHRPLPDGLLELMQHVITGQK